MIKRILAIMMCVALICVYLALPASACTTVYNPWVWDATVTPTALSVRFSSTEYRMRIYSGTSVMVWNDISSNIHISSYTATVDSSSYDADINMQVIAMSDDALGRTRYYKYNDATGTMMEMSSATSLITQVRITFSPELFDLGSEAIRKTVIHEIGHGLGLRHPTCSTLSVMHQRGMPYEATTIQPHDRTTLQNKWGV